jgi:hypothetical protein
MSFDAVRSDTVSQTDVLEINKYKSNVNNNGKCGSLCDVLNLTQTLFPSLAT